MRQYEILTNTCRILSLDKTGLYKAKIGTKMDAWITYLLLVTKLPDSNPVGGNGHQPPRKWWPHLGIYCLSCSLSSRKKETVGFSRHFSCSFNMGELRSLGLQRLDREPKAGGISSEQMVPIFKLLLLSFTPPFLCCTMHSISRTIVHCVRKS